MEGLQVDHRVWGRLPLWKGDISEQCPSKGLLLSWSAGRALLKQQVLQTRGKGVGAPSSPRSGIREKPRPGQVLACVSGKAAGGVRSKTKLSGL